jgi:hypothetical protein
MSDNKLNGGEYGRVRRNQKDLYRKTNKKKDL